MATSGPKDPTRPVGSPHDMSLTVDGSGARWQEFEDGWMYELFAPVGAGPAVMPRAKTARLIFSAHWLAAFEDDGTNYLTLWVPRAVHEELFPAGPPQFRFYDVEGTKAAQERFARWGDPNETNPGGGEKTQELKIVDIARLVEETEHKIS